MTFKVFIIADAERDILEICDYISRSDSIEKSVDIFKQIKKKILSLENHPQRGHYPPELERIDIYEYREIHFKLYRIIYQIFASKVYVHCVLDGRRELAELLGKRLLRT